MIDRQVTAHVLRTYTDSALPNQLLMNVANKQQIKNHTVYTRFEMVLLHRKAKTAHTTG